MSMLPEEFPVVLTIFMAMGAMRMSRERVLTRQASAIETLGSATVLCTDKTGTLTQNRMRIAELRLPDGRVLVHDGEADLTLEGEFHLLAELGILASAQEAVDPMEVAFHELGDEHASETIRARQQAGWTLHHHYPLDPSLLAMSHVWGATGRVKSGSLPPRARQRLSQPFADCPTMTKGSWNEPSMRWPGTACGCSVLPMLAGRMGICPRRSAALHSRTEDWSVLPIPCEPRCLMPSVNAEKQASGWS
jgi:hypothetical protein